MREIAIIRLQVMKIRSYRDKHMDLFRPTLICLAILSCLIASPVCAADAKVGDLVISEAWSRATPSGAKVAGGYLTIENKGTSPDRLTGATCDIAGKVEVHEMAMNNGVMTMRPLGKGLTIEPGKTVKLAPGGYHLMLMNLKNPLKQGEQVPLTLEFERSGKVTLSLDVQGIGASRRAAAAADDESFFTHLHTDKAMANVTVSPAREGLVDITIQLETVEELPLSVQAVSVMLSNTQSGAEPQTFQAAPDR